MKKFDVVFPTVRRVKRSLFRLNALIAKIISFLLEGAVIHKKWNFNGSYMIQNHGDVFLPPSQLLVDPKHTSLKGPLKALRPSGMRYTASKSLVFAAPFGFLISSVVGCVHRSVSTFWLLDLFCDDVTISSVTWIHLPKVLNLLLIVF